MTKEKDNRIYKVLLGLLLLGLIAVSVWAYKNYNENESIKADLRDEQVQIQKELENISAEYTAEIDKGNVLNAELTSANDRITRLVDSVSRLEADVKVISRLRKELAKIKQERTALKERITVLETLNKDLSRVNDSTLAALNEEMIKSQEQSDMLSKLNENMSRAATLVPTNFTTQGVIIRRSGKQIENDKARRVDDLKVCFTLPQNPLAQDGVTEFYLQVINPENNVIGSKAQQQFDGQSLTYSKLIKFNYQNKELDICELINAGEDEITSGRYRINLYNGPVRISSSEITLR
ncbi:hypothetical protein [Nonlabens tegetincola]|uniref:hypothetical protein n=1 Tax=Nonlabens tegetincola TaxID=323273 RepID=UPI000CF56ECE|nr:hypothetical protein [Nonlabens tegetincola]PQJ20582.1 hypothetical protein BST93_02260 [Nonlabens tegetincola]